MTRPAPEHGMSLVELMVALVVLTIVISGVAQIFRSSRRGMTDDQLFVAATAEAHDVLESLSARTWSDTALTSGRHPTGTAMLSVPGTRMQSWHDVATFASPMDGAKQVTVHVRYAVEGGRAREVRATTYLRR